MNKPTELDLKTRLEMAEAAIKRLTIAKAAIDPNPNAELLAGYVLELLEEVERLDIAQKVWYDHYLNVVHRMQDQETLR